MTTKQKHDGITVIYNRTVAGGGDGTTVPDNITMTGGDHVHHQNMAAIVEGGMGNNTTNRGDHVHHQNMAAIVEGGMGNNTTNTFQYKVQQFGDVTNVIFSATQNTGQSEDEEKPLTTVQKIRKRTESRIQSWTQGMVKTQAHQEVMEKIDRGATWVTIKGRPGEGKSTVAYMALRDLHSQGRQVFQVVSPDEFNEVTRTCTNPVIMLDDIFGDLEFDVAEWTKWRPSLRPILDLQKPDVELNGALNASTDINPEQNRKKQSLFILVGRDYVLKSSLPDLGRVKEYLTSSKHLVQLSPTRGHEEKLNILKSIFRMEGVDFEEKVMFELSHIDCPHGFPHVCRLFATTFKQNPKVSAKEFFASPLVFLNQTLQKLINNKSKGQLLKAMIQGDGKVSQSELYKDKYKMHDCVSSANELVGSYLKLEDGTYMFDHPSIYDSVAFLLTEKDPVFVIENCSLSFINQRLRHGTVENQELVADIPLFCIDNLVQRFALEIQLGNLAYVISHQVCCDPDFIDKLMNILNVQYQISVNTFLRNTDKETLQSCLELLPSNKSSTMVKYILEKGNITLQQMEIDEILLGVCKHATGNVLTYLTKHVKLDVDATYGHSEQTPLMLAAETGDCNFVHQILRLHPDLNASDRYDKTVLHYLCEHGLVSAVEYVIDKGVDIDVTDQMRQTSLFLACWSGHKGVVKLLLDRGAAVNVDNYHTSPLDAACLRGYKKLVPDRGDDDSMVLTCLKGMEETETFLLDVRRLIPSLDNPFKPLYAACTRGHTNIVKTLLLAGAELSGDEVCAACTSGNLDIVKMLFDEGGTVNMISKDGQLPLHAACESGKLDVVRVLTGKGANVSMVAPNGNTTLHAACKRGSHEVLLFLLEKLHTSHGEEEEDVFRQQKADINSNIQTRDIPAVNVEDNTRNTPLHGASMCGSKECVDMLLKAGADVKVQNKTGDTPLHEASGCGSQKCVDMLLKAGAGVNVENTTGNTPLHGASKRGSKECVDMLLKAGADVNVQNTTSGVSCGSRECDHLLLKPRADIQIQDGTGDTPLHNASSCGCQKCVDLLLKAGADVKVQNQTGDTPLHNASGCGSQKCVHMLLKAGADVKVQNKTGDTPLHEASESGSQKCVDMLLKAGAVVNVENTTGDTPLHRASKRGSKECVDLLLKASAAIQVHNKRGDTPLHGASLYGSKKCVDMLLKTGADVNVQNTTGNTPLHAASGYKSKECVDVLLKAGANVNVQNTKGNTPLHFASNSGSKKCVDLLLKTGADVRVQNTIGNTPLHGASNNGSKKCVDLLLEAGADVNVQDTTGNTPLHEASLNGSKECVDLLLKAGADIQVQNRKGDTPLHNASRYGSHRRVDMLVRAEVKDDTPLLGASMYGSKECVDLLLKAGTDVNVQNTKGNTPLHCASLNGSKKCVDLLLKAGADVNVQNTTRNTSLHGASLCGSKECVDLLLNAGADTQVRNIQGDTPLLNISR
ncbi:serine/threonine-protein phosphatase 6 regulatory ankyrin repeat subunit A-like [Haliotis rufescens]|uniref:serine/threonine-protein phosphatase 6 regulatory ankyrin repeat subunit A-like n=1 Tax=Haliotis rufescens TaxID=6454 RepID=UPI00201EF400|nr:serine/threonine-protein phosphatase 6 regulatory ankyrin repeat subunit A-like [Haliotis rufescens]XP_048250519.1 serine/threonine-protein phosphatase 6 regulatory ankyrin repeat subunit A-like [Haliotis rufescens]